MQNCVLCIDVNCSALLVTFAKTGTLDITSLLHVLCYFVPFVFVSDFIIVYVVLV